MIPKLIHQTARTPDISKQARQFQQRIRDQHPDWTYKLWTDADNDAFVRAEMPDFYPVFAGLPKGIMRADVIRYVLMDRVGGLYLDTDYEMLRPFDLLSYECVVPLETSGEEARLGNAYFAAAPGHLFFRRVLQTLKDAPPRDPDADVLSSTGPAFITRVYRSMTPEEQAQVHTPAREIFNPLVPRNGREYRRLARNPEIYGIHHCLGTWREFTFLQRIRNWAGDAYHKVR